MPRPKPLVPANKQFTVRITDDDDALIDQLVALDAGEHEESQNRTRWFVRLLRREARYRRLMPEKGTAQPTVAASPERPAKSKEREYRSDG